MTVLLTEMPRLPSRGPVHLQRAFTARDRLLLLGCCIGAGILYFALRPKSDQEPPQSRIHIHSVMGSVDNPPWLAARIVVYQGERCDAGLLMAQCGTRDIRGGIRPDCSTGAGCFEQALITARVERLPGSKLSYDVVFESPIKGTYLVHIRKEYESKAQALADCSFDEAMEYVEDPTAHYIGEAIPHSPRVQLQGANAAAAVRGFWMKLPSQTRPKTICPEFGPSHFHWVQGGHVGCMEVAELKQRVESTGLRKLIVVGDSVGREITKVLRKQLHFAAVAIEYAEIKPKPPIRTLELIQQQLSKLTVSEHPPTLLFNPASLWWCAYGRVSDYSWVLEQILPLMQQLVLASKAKVFFWTGTAVYPINYYPDVLGSNKVCMTEPRIERLNDIALQKLKEIAPQVQIIDLWHMSATREDDPMSWQDMRHNGIETYSEMGSYILRVVTSSGGNRSL